MLRGALVLLLMAFPSLGRASEPSADPDGEQAARIAELEQTVSHLQAQVDALTGLEMSSDSSESDSALAMDEACEEPSFTHGVIYDEGWVLRPIDPEQTPYELKFGLHNQFRYTGFAPEESTIINAAGQTVNIPERNDFGINRGRILLSGYAIDPLLEFYANIDYNTVADQPIQMLMAWIRHPFDPAFNLAYGLGKVPGTWEWQETARYTLGAERSLATTFFRPSMTAGVWADGEPLPGLHYRALVGNGFNTFSLNSSQLDAHLAYSGMLWWEPWGDFGQGFSDFENHSESVIRLGHALTYSQQDADPSGEPGPEQTIIRLSDGTRLVETDALAPGVTVNQFDLTLYGIHAGWKRQGLSVSGECFSRWLTGISANGPIPDQAIYDHGYFAQAGVFVLPQSVELFVRSSEVFGPFGNGSELGGGFNWYIMQNQNWRFTMDVCQVDSSPAQQDRTGFLAGASGLLVRTQVWTAF